MVWFPPAKINLGLHVLGKREDGYHDIESCFYPTGWTDILEIIPADNFTFTSSGISIPGDEQENIVIKAYHLLRSAHDLPAVHIHLHKIIPMGAGLGGGSADAAYTLRGLNEIFSLDLSNAQLREYASKLGSDCAFFIQDIAMLAKGRGENLTSIDLSLKEYALVIVYPEIHVDTATAYSKIQPSEDHPPLKDILNLPVREWKDHLINDFEKTVFAKHPEIKVVKNKLYDSGALYASMTGSGSAVFGLFSSVQDYIISLFDEYPVYISRLS